MNLLLDTNVCIEVLRGRNLQVIARYAETDPERISLPSIVAAELLLGGAKSNRERATQEVERFLAAHEILPFGEPECREYVRIRHDLESRGQKIGANDLLIAATAIALGLMLVTSNADEFGRVEGLATMDWES